jgi:hypothetical protein
VADPEAVGLATRVGDWFTTRRLLEPIGCVARAEYEAECYGRLHPATTEEGAVAGILHLRRPMIIGPGGLGEVETEKNPFSMARPSH